MERVWLALLVGRKNTHKIAAGHVRVSVSPIFLGVVVAVIYDPAGNNDGLCTKTARTNCITHTSLGRSVAFFPFGHCALDDLSVWRLG